MGCNCLGVTVFERVRHRKAGRQPARNEAVHTGCSTEPTQCGSLTSWCLNLGLPHSSPAHVRARWPRWTPTRPAVSLGHRQSWSAFLPRRRNPRRWLSLRSTRKAPCHRAGDRSAGVGHTSIFGPPLCELQVVGPPAEERTRPGGQRPEGGVGYGIRCIRLIRCTRCANSAVGCWASNEGSNCSMANNCPPMREP